MVNKKCYWCPSCGNKLEYNMFCPYCCSTWATLPRVEEQEESNKNFIAWATGEGKDIFSHFDNMKSPRNNGGDTDYYLIPENAKYCQDIIESRNMNFSQGNIFKAAFCFGIKRGDSDYERDLNKIIWFANRELERINT